MPDSIVARQNAATKPETWPGRRPDPVAEVETQDIVISSTKARRMESGRHGDTSRDNNIEVIWPTSVMHRLRLPFLSRDLGAIFPLADMCDGALHLASISEHASI